MPNAENTQKSLISQLFSYRHLYRSVPCMSSPECGGAGLGVEIILYELIKIQGSWNVSQKWVVTYREWLKGCPDTYNQKFFLINSLVTVGIVHVESNPESSFGF